MANSPKILFASYHSLLDNTSGAAICTRHTLADLNHLGWEAMAFTGPVVDGARRTPGEQLEMDGAEMEVVNTTRNGRTFTLTHDLHEGILGIGNKALG